MGDGSHVCHSPLYCSSAVVVVWREEREGEIRMLPWTQQLGQDSPFPAGTALLTALAYEPACMVECDLWSWLCTAPSAAGLWAVQGDSSVYKGEQGGVHHSQQGVVKIQCVGW